MILPNTPPLPQQIQQYMKRYSEHLTHLKDWDIGLSGQYVIVLLGANGDISRCAQHYIQHIPKPLKKPIWVVGRKYLAILEQLYGDYFTPYPLDLPQNNPILATEIARKKWPMAKVGNIQQNGSDPEMLETKQYHSYQEYQIAKLEELFKA